MTASNFADSSPILSTFALWQVVNDVIAKISDRTILEIKQSIVDAVDSLVISGHLRHGFHTSDLSEMIDRMIDAHPGIQKPLHARPR